MRICKNLLTKMQIFLPFTASFSVFGVKLTVEKGKIAGKPRLHFAVGYGMIGKMKGEMPCEKSEKYTAVGGGDFLRDLFLVVDNLLFD